MGADKAIDGNTEMFAQSGDAGVGGSAVWSANWGGCKKISEVKVTAYDMSLKYAKVEIVNEDSGNSKTDCGFVHTTDTSWNQVYTVNCPADTKGTKI
jgi:hypothetical protein